MISLPAVLRTMRDDMFSLCAKMRTRRTSLQTLSASGYEFSPDS